MEQILVSTKQLSQVLSLSEDVIRGLARQGVIRPLRIGHSVRWDIGAVRRWIASETNQVEA
jgi:predicted DNA-binding transcriptional regulator AlpA